MQAECASSRRRDLISVSLEGTPAGVHTLKRFLSRISSIFRTSHALGADIFVWFQLFVLYGRKNVGKTTLLNEFCRNKDTIFYSAEQSNDKLNFEKFSSCTNTF